MLFKRKSKESKAGAGAKPGSAARLTSTSHPASSNPDPKNPPISEGVAVVQHPEDDRKFYFIGNFPDPDTSGRLKNSLLFEELSKRVNIEKIVAERSKASWIAKQVFKSRNSFFILGNGNTAELRRFLFMVDATRPGMYKNMTLVNSDPRFTREATTDDTLKRACKKMPAVYVENEWAKSVLEAKKGKYKNVRIMPGLREPVEGIGSRGSDGKFRVVNFANFSKTNGTDRLLEVASKLPDVEFHIYGEVDPDYKDEFRQKVGSRRNVINRGKFQGSRAKAILEMSRYDVHIFPVEEDFEVLADTIVDSKVAGIPTVAFDTSSMKGIVEDGVDGLLTNMEEDPISSMAEAIARLRGNRELLTSMKKATLDESERYFASRYAEEIDTLFR